MTTPHRRCHPRQRRRRHPPADRCQDAAHLSKAPCLCRGVLSIDGVR
ncbi:hypothetical protein ACP70R_047790 [Stipagrostis hirtigluma subsp. patula]